VSERAVKNQGFEQDRTATAIENVIDAQEYGRDPDPTDLVVADLAVAGFESPHPCVSDQPPLEGDQREYSSTAIYSLEPPPTTLKARRHGAVEAGLCESRAEPAVVVDDDAKIFRRTRNNRGPFTHTQLPLNRQRLHRGL
jgi:hypothetical protein